MVKPTRVYCVSLMLNSLGELCITIPKNQSCSESDPTVPRSSTSAPSYLVDGFCPWCTPLHYHLAQVTGWSYL